MSYLKTLTSKDIIVTPFTVHKQFSYSGQVPTYNNGEEFVVFYSEGDYPDVGGDLTTGSRALVYASLYQLYYANYDQDTGRIKSSSLPVFNPDGTIEGDPFVASYQNNPQSIDELRYNNTTKSKLVMSIPSKKFGEYIKPGSFTASFNRGFGSPFPVKDDGQGNIFNLNGVQRHQGNIFYKSGLVTYIPEEGREGVAGSGNISDPKWKSSRIIYETQYKCTIRANEFNYSLNPSLLSSSLRGQNDILNSGSATYEDFVTGSDFSPYVTTVGLYDNKQNLLAVAKLAQPLPTSQTTDTTILINLDR